MRVYRISKCRYVNDCSGYGAFLQGGRWNSKGQWVLYTAQSVSLAMLELLVHLPASLAADDFCVLTLELPESAIKVLAAEQLPQGWDAYPFNASTRQIGDHFLQTASGLALQVPSCIVPGEYNLLINPRHPVFDQKVRVVSSEPIRIDRRLLD